MAIRNEFIGTTDFTEEGLRPTDLNDTFDAVLQQTYADNTGGSVSGSTTETDLATVTIPANDLNNNATLMIQAAIRHNSTNNLAITFTWRLYVDGSVVKTINHSVAVTNNANDGAGSIVYRHTGLDLTSSKEIKVKVK